jgi:hypothetical protein
MKLGIYGDSFACINTRWGDGIVDKPHLGISWVEILENAGHEINNYAVSGTAFMFSYERFLKEHKNNDLNIFVVTSPHRVYIKELDGRRLFSYTWADEEYERVKKLPFYPKQQIHLDILKSARTYLELWADWEMINHTQQVLVNNLWNLAPNTIVIPAFFNSIEQTTINLFYAAKYELKLVNEKEHTNFDFAYLDCQRKCHFSNENNIVLGNKVLRAIENNEKIVTLHIDEVAKPANSDFYFYVKSNKNTI